MKPIGADNDVDVPTLETPDGIMLHAAAWALDVTPESLGEKVRQRRGKQFTNVQLAAWLIYHHTAPLFPQPGWRDVARILGYCPGTSMFRAQRGRFPTLPERGGAATIVALRYAHALHALVVKRLSPEQITPMPLPNPTAALAHLEGVA